MGVVLLFGIVVIGGSAAVATVWADAILGGYSPKGVLCKHTWSDWLPSDPFEDHSETWSCICVKCAVVQVSLTRQ